MKLFFAGWGTDKLEVSIEIKIYIAITTSLLTRTDSNNIFQYEVR